MDSSYVLDYVLKIITIHGIFFLLYFGLLRNKTSHRLNRTYLLVTLLLAFFIPALEFTVPEETVIILPEPATFHFEESMVADTDDSVMIEEILVEEPSLDLWTLARWGYLILSASLILRSLFHLLILQKLKTQSQYVERKWFKLFKTSQSHPFSFLSNVFIPKVIFGTTAFDRILEHECEHVRQHHSLDRLLLDFMVALFWFNPFIFLYRKALIEIHEYQADAAVLKKFPDPIEYQEVLFSQLSTASYSGLVSHFNFSTIKKRIVMINKRNNKHSTWAYLLAVPVTLWVILAFSSRIDEGLPTDRDEDTNDKTEEGYERQEVPRPSISPVKDEDLVRLTSGFGMRTHPIYKVKKMHLGADFAVPIGTEIVATGDGVVSRVEDMPKGYGKWILIDHGDKYQTKYAQLSEIIVNKGDVVKKGQKIALSGNSGLSTAPHLHYEVIEVGVGHKDPMQFISNLKVKYDSGSKEDKLREMAEDEGDSKEELPEREEEGPLDREDEGEEIAEEQEMMEVEAPAVAVEEMEEQEPVQIEVDELDLPSNQLVRIEEGTVKVRADSNLKPLFIIDGEVVEEVSDIDPDDIESINVLKGKSAKKLYGKDGDNGVVEIQTKKGPKGKLKSKDKLKEKDKKKSKGIGLNKPSPLFKKRALLQNEAIALAVEKGEVTNVSTISGIGKVVIVLHAGDKRTVYSGLESVEVATGDRLKRGDRLGEYKEDATDRFQVYHGTVRQSARGAASGTL